MAGQHVHDIRDTGPSGPGRRPGYTVGPGAFWLMVFLSLCGIAFFILLCIWGWGPHGGSAGGFQAVNEQAIAERPADYYGHRVMTGGTVEAVLGPREFTIGGGPMGPPLLVLTRKNMTEAKSRPGGPALIAGEVAVLNGTVQKFEPRVANSLGISLTPEVTKQWEGKPVLVADEAVVTPKGG